LYRLTQAPRRSEQDWHNNVTVLSGDIGTAGNPSDNCYHVVNLGIGTANITIDGFTITAGNADDLDYNSLGGGLFNQADNVKICNCSFIGNSADYGGGLLYDGVGNAKLINCLFSGNKSNIDGGGVYNALASPSLANCTFSNNQATGSGGAIYNYNASPAITNCIIWGNTAASGSSVYNHGTSQPYISYSDVAGCGGSGANWVAAMGIDGDNNIDANPLFTDADGPDNIAGTLDDDLSLSTGSPCIGTGIAGENMGVNIPVDATAVVNPVAVTDPVDLAIDSDGQLYVLSSSQNQVLIYNDQLVWQSTVTISATNPKGLFVDDNKNIYIADTGGDRILKYLYNSGSYPLDTTFDTDGIVGTSGSGDGQFNQPWKIAVDYEGNVYVTDSGNDRVQIFSSAGTFISKWGQTGSANGQIDNPRGFYLSPTVVDGEIFLADTGNHRIQRLSMAGGYFFSAAGSYGSGAGQFNGPTSTCYDPQRDQLIVADTGNNRLQILQLSSYGEFSNSEMNYTSQIADLGLPTLSARQFTTACIGTLQNRIESG